MDRERQRGARPRGITSGMFPKTQANSLATIDSIQQSSGGDASDRGSLAPHGTVAQSKLPFWFPAMLLAVLGACIFLLRLLAPPDLLDQDQERPAAYVLDAVRN